MSEDQLALNAGALANILAINHAIQHQGAKLHLLDKQVVCVALNGTCTFDDSDGSEVLLTNTQLGELIEQVVQHNAKLQQDDDRLAAIKRYMIQEIMRDDNIHD